MDIQISDFSFMDYDTYHQIIGGSFLDYVLWMESMKPCSLEDFSFSKLEKEEPLLDKEERKKDRDSVLLEILLFLLELFSPHYGTFSPSSTYLEKTEKEKIQELLSFYASVGLSQEEILGVVKKYGKSLRKGRTK